MIAGALPLAAALGGCSDTASPARHATFVSLGILSGYTSSQASAVSSDGTVVVGTVATAARNRQAFRWNAVQGMAGLGFLPGGSYSTASSVSANGAVIVGNGDATSSSPLAAGFRWTADGGAQPVDALSGSAICNVAGVSGDGTGVVGTCLQVNDTAFRWTASTGAVALSRFGTGSNQQSAALGISLDGSVIVGTGHPVLTGAVTWAVDGSATVLGKLPGYATGTATAVSRDGSVVVGASTDNAGMSRAIRWTQPTGMVDIGNGVAGLLGSFANSVSGNGRVVVGYGTTAAGDVALIWDADHGLRLLDAALADDFQMQIPGWRLTQATAISDDARTIAGYATNPQGQTEAWIVKLPD